MLYLCRELILTYSYMSRTFSPQRLYRRGNTTISLIFSCLDYWKWTPSNVTDSAIFLNILSKTSIYYTWSSLDDWASSLKLKTFRKGLRLYFTWGSEVDLSNSYRYNANLKDLLPILCSVKDIAKRLQVMLST